MDCAEQHDQAGPEDPDSRDGDDDQDALNSSPLESLSSAGAELGPSVHVAETSAPLDTVTGLGQVPAAIPVPV